MPERREYNLLYPEEEKKLLNRLIWSLVFAFVAYAFLVLNPVTYLPVEKNEQETESVVLDVDKNIYFLSEIPEIEGFFPYEKITIKDAEHIETPSLFFVSDEELEGANKNAKIFNHLIESGHLVLFVGYDLNPESVAEVFIENQIPVVPIDSSIKIHFHSYGAVYNKQQGLIIPTFYASNISDQIRKADFIDFINDINSEYMISDSSDINIED